MDEYPKDYFRHVRKMIISSGLWTPKHSTSRIYKLYFYISFVGVMFIYLFMESMSFMHTYKDLDACTKTLSMFGQHFLGTIKGCIWLKYSQKLLFIIETLENPKYQYESYKEFKPGATTKNFIKNNRYLTTMYYGTAVNVAATSTVSGISNLLRVENYISDPIKGIYGEKLPFFLWSPLDITSSMKNFVTIFVYQEYCILLYALIIGSLDVFCYDIIRHVTAHVKILKGALTTIRERAMIKATKDKVAFGDELVDSVEFEKYMNYELFKCIDHSQMLLRVCADLEHIYKFIVLGQFFTTTVMSCTTLYIVASINVNSSRFIAEMWYLSAIYIQISVLSWNGHQLTAEWSEVPDAIYASNWLSSSTRYKRTLTFMMRRFLNPVMITIGNFAPLSLAAFINLIKTSYSFFTLLKQSKN